MRKWAFLISLTLLVCLGLSACGGNGKYDNEVKLARAALEENWRKVYRQARESGYKTDGYLEIKNTRVIVLKDSAPDFLRKDGCRYLVEFVLYSDYYGAKPYYFATEFQNTVSLSTDGRAAVQQRNPLREYNAITFDFEFDKFIESIHDLGDAYNAVFNF